MKFQFEKQYFLKTIDLTSMEILIVISSWQLHVQS